MQASRQMHALQGRTHTCFPDSSESKLSQLSSDERVSMGTSSRKPTNSSSSLGALKMSATSLGIWFELGKKENKIRDCYNHLGKFSQGAGITIPWLHPSAMAAHKTPVTMSKMCLNWHLMAIREGVEKKSFSLKILELYPILQGMSRPYIFR